MTKSKLTTLRDTLTVALALSEIKDIEMITIHSGGRATDLPILHSRAGDLFKSSLQACLDSYDRQLTKTLNNMLEKGN